MRRIEVPEGRPNSEWTVEQIKAYIRRETAEVNIRLGEFREEKYDARVQSSLEKMVKEMKSRSGVKSGGNRGEIGTGLGGRYRRKSELLYQARGLEQFEQFDVFSQEAEKEINEKTRKSYETFEKLYNTGMSIDEYVDVVEIMGSVGGEILGKFNYMGVVEAYTEAKRTGREINLVSLINETIKASRGQGWDSRQIADEIVRKIEI